MLPSLASFVGILRHTVFSLLICTFLPIDFIGVNAYISRPHNAQKSLYSLHSSVWGLSSRQATSTRFSPSLRRIIHCGTVTNLRSSNDPNNSDFTRSRRDMIYSSLKLPVLTVALYAYGRVLYNALSSPSILSLFNDGAPIYPAQHEQHISKVIEIAFDAASDTSTKIFRVLEVGIGTEARLIRRGIYKDAMHQLSDKKHTRRLEITGLDIHTPTKEVVLDAINVLIQQLNESENMNVSFNTVQSSITDPLLQYTNGYFDSIVCCFTLCSVNDPILALRTMKRLLRPNGGTIAYLEHVAVAEDDTNHQWLSYEQQLFDPVQQILADHCHLHRATESTMDTVFPENVKIASPVKYNTLYRERFYIDQMWPVSCQACGVIQSSA